MDAPRSRPAQSSAPAQPPPEDARVDLGITYRDQAIRLSQEERFAEAEASAREALRLRPNDVDVLNELGVAVWRQGRSAEAEEIYARARQLAPDDTNSLWGQRQVPVLLMEQRISTSKKLGRRPTTEDRLAFGRQLVEVMAEAVLKAD